MSWSGEQSGTAVSWASGEQSGLAAFWAGEGEPAVNGPTTALVIPSAGDDDTATVGDPSTPFKTIAIAQAAAALVAAATPATASIVVYPGAYTEGGLGADKVNYDLLNGVIFNYVDDADPSPQLSGVTFSDILTFTSNNHQIATNVAKTFVVEGQGILRRSSTIVPTGTLVGHVVCSHPNSNMQFRFKELSCLWFSSGAAYGASALGVFQLGGNLSIDVDHLVAKDYGNIKWMAGNFTLTGRLAEELGVNGSSGGLFTTGIGTSNNTPTLYATDGSSIREQVGNWTLSVNFEERITSTTDYTFELLLGHLVGTVSISNASPAVATMAHHGMTTGLGIQFSGSGTMPAGLSKGTTYYVNVLTADTFAVSATSGGAAINTTGNQVGTISATDVTSKKTVYIQAPQITSAGSVLHLAGQPLNGDTFHVKTPHLGVISAAPIVYTDLPNSYIASLGNYDGGPTGCNGTIEAPLMSAGADGGFRLAHNSGTVTIKFTTMQFLVTSAHAQAYGFWLTGTGTTLVQGPGTLTGNSATTGIYHNGTGSLTVANVTIDTSAAPGQNPVFVDHNGLTLSDDTLIAHTNELSILTAGSPITITVNGTLTCNNAVDTPNIIWAGPGKVIANSVQVYNGSP